MKLKPALLPLMLIFSLCACTSLPAKQSCTASGTIGTDKVPHPTQGFEISFQYYLPPCYGKQVRARFPVIYLITMPLELHFSATDNTPMSLAERLIHAGKMPAAMIIVPDDTVAQGYQRALTLDLVPYVDAKYKTLPDRRSRAVGGISHGAGIAARMAFEFPSVFGSLGVLSGGIDPTEKATFEMWIAAASAEERLRVLIDVGDRDGIMPFTRNLVDVLNSQHVPYELNIDPGDHNWAFWSAHMESVLLWFAEAWQ